MRETSFGPYRVVRSLGAGGMGEVFLAEHELIGRKAAIKVLHADRAERRESVDRFFNEARAAAVISDPGIVQIYDFGFTPAGTAYIVMENLDGESLNNRLNRLVALPIADALRIVRQVAGSLAAAHEVGIVHRDLKPDNLFMVRDPEAAGGERPKILDFGIAKLSGETNRFKTRTGAVMGTPVYMSPEQCNDSGKIDHRSDIYSLGCVLFHLLTGSPPFDHAGVGALISAHMGEVPRAPSSVVPHLPSLVDQIVLRCLAKDPQDRFASMQELQQACDHALSESARWTPYPAFQQPHTTVPDSIAKTTLNGSAGQTLHRSTPSSKGLWIGVVAIAMLIGVGVAFAIGGRDGELQPAAGPPPVPGETPPGHPKPRRTRTPAPRQPPPAPRRPPPVPRHLPRVPRRTRTPVPRHPVRRHPPPGPPPRRS